MFSVPVLVNNPAFSEPVNVKLPEFVALPLSNEPRVAIPVLPIEPPLKVVTMRLPEFVAVPPLRVVTVAVPLLESVPVEESVVIVAVPALVKSPAD